MLLRNFTGAVLLIAWVVLFEFDTNLSASDRPLAEFPIQDARSLVSVPVTTPEGTFDFVLDTGATVSVYSSSMRWPDKPVKIEVPRTHGKDREIPFYRRPPSTIGTLELPHNDLIAVIDFKELSSARGRQIDGILGMDALATFIIQFDFDSGTLRFWDTLPNDCGKRIALNQSRAKVPRISVDLGESPFEVVLDTGLSRELQVTPTRWRDLQEHRRIFGTRVVNLATANGTVFSNQGLINGVGIGEDSFQSVQLGVSQIETLGIGFLSRYVATIDFPRNAIYLKPGRNFSTPLPRDASGMGLLQKDGEVVVAFVTEDSPAALVGIQKGDVLTKVKRRKTDNWKLTELRNDLSKPGESIELVVKRENQLINFSMKLTDY